MRVFTLLLAVLLGATPAVASSTEAPDGLTPHPPIVVVGDEGPTGFVLVHDPLTGEPIYRPGSGVVGGTGTEDDPFVIAGWELVAVHIRDTSAHVEIRDNVIGGLPVEPGNVYVAAASNVRIVGNRVTAGTRGIFLSESSAVTVTGNRIEDTGYAIVTEETSDLAITGNEMTHSGQGQRAVWAIRGAGVLVEGNVAGSYHTAFYIVEVEDLLVRDNDVGTFARGVNLWFTDGAVVEDNVIAGPEGGGVILIESSDTVVRRNRVDGSEIAVWVAGQGSGNLITANVATNAGTGVALTNTGAHEVRGNTLAGNGTGLVFVRPGGSSASANEITANGVGVWSTEGGPAPPTLRGNNIHANGTGLLNDTAEPVDARENWWGCAAGPGQPGCDSAQGDVLVAPWLEEPSPLAGAAPAPGSGS